MNAVLGIEKSEPQAVNANENEAGKKEEEGQEEQVSEESAGSVALSSFVPSKKRNLTGVLEAAATGNQPIGKALPSLIKGEPKIRGRHLAAAKRANPFQCLLDAAISEDARAIFAECAVRPDLVLAKRLKAKGGDFEDG